MAWWAEASLSQILNKYCHLAVALLLCVDAFRNGIHPFFALCRSYHLGEETRAKQLNTNDNGQKREIEQRSVRHTIGVGKQTNVSQINSDDKTYEEGDGT